MHPKGFPVLPSGGRKLLICMQRPFTNQNMFRKNMPRDPAESKTKAIKSLRGRRFRRHHKELEQTKIVTKKPKAHPSLFLPAYPVPPPQDVIEVLSRHPKLEAQKRRSWKEHTGEIASIFEEYPFPDVDPYITSKKDLREMSYITEEDHFEQQLQEFASHLQESQTVYAIWAIQEDDEGIYTVTYHSEWVYRRGAIKAKSSAYTIRNFDTGRNYYFWFDAEGSYHCSRMKP